MVLSRFLYLAVNGISGSSVLDFQKRKFELFREKNLAFFFQIVQFEIRKIVVSKIRNLTLMYNMLTIFLKILLFVFRF